MERCADTAAACLRGDRQLPQLERKPVLFRRAVGQGGQVAAGTAVGKAHQTAMGALGQYQDEARLFAVAGQTADQFRDPGPCHAPGAGGVDGGGEVGQRGEMSADVGRRGQVEA